MKLVKVVDSNFVRDIDSMALINTNNNEKEEYYNKVRIMKRQRIEMDELKSEINDIKEEMSEIKVLLNKILEKASS